MTIEQHLEEALGQFAADTPQGIRTKLIIPNILDHYLNRYKRAHTAVHQIRRGVWTDGQCLQTKPMLIIRMAVIGLKAFNDELVQLEEEAGLTAAQASDN